MARKFGGTDADKIDCGGSSILNPTTAMTFVCWAYPTSFPNPYNVICKRIDAGGTHYYSIQPKSTGKLALYFIDSTNTAHNIDPGTNFLSTNTWYHLAFTLGASAGNLYVNGILDSTVASSGGVATIAAHTSIGWDTSTANSGWAGYLQDCAIYNLALTTNELLALAHGQRPGNIRPGSLVAWWDFDGYGHPALDRTIYNNNGTVTGTSFAPGPTLINAAPIMLTTVNSGQAFLKRSPLMVAAALPKIKSAATNPVVFRKTLSQIGGRVGTRQIQGWAN